MVDESRQIVRPAVAVIDVVGVLPYIAAKDRRCSMNQRVLAIRRLHDLKLAAFHRKPAPARSELGHAGFNELAAEFVKGANVRGDRLLKRSGK